MTGPGSADPLRIAIVGCGAISETHAQAIAALPQEFGRLAACSDVDQDLAAKFSQRFDIPALSFDALLRDPQIDVVAVCTPSGVHADLGTAALDAGKHVLVEKPMDVSVEACERLLAAQKRSGRRLGVVSQHRFDAASVTVRQALDEGALGRIFYAEASIPWYRTQEYYDSGDWRGTLEMDGGGCLMNQGIHTLDLLRWFCGPAEKVRATMKTIAHERIEVEDFLSATIEFQSGIHGRLVASTAMYPGFLAKIALYGSGGSAIIEGDTLHTLAIRGRPILESKDAAAHALDVARGGTRAAKEGVAVGKIAADGSSWGDAHRAQYEEFLRCCRTGEEPLVNGWEGRESVALVCAIYEAARRGEAVTL